MNLRELANKADLFGGSVTLWMLGYQSLKVDACVDALERIEPQFRYTNTRTGETTTVEPAEYRLAQEMEKKTGVPSSSVWTQERLWTGIHNLFTIVLSAVVDFEFAQKLPVAARGLKAYLDNRTDDTLANWRLFKEVVGSKAYAELWEAYAATRDTDMDIVPSPNGIAEGEATETPSAIIYEPS